MLKVATVCSGIGSPEQALSELNLPHEITFACEIDKYARQTYLANFNPNVMLEDMTTADWTNPKLYADLVIGGIPCQSFSLAGKRKGELDPRGTLFYNFYDYVKKQQPKYFIIENVKGLLSDANGRTFQNWLDLLSQSVNTHYNMFNHEDSLLYNVHHTVLNSKDFGVPQNRERVFIVGLRNDLPNTFRFPIEQPLTKRLKDVLQETVDEKYYLSDKILNYLMNRKDNFNNGKINYKYEGDIASCSNATSKSLDISDNIIVTNNRGHLEQQEIFNCIDANYHKGMDNHAQRSFIQEPIYIAHLQRTEEAKEIRKQNMRKGKDSTPFQAKEILFKPSEIMNTITCKTQKDNLICVAMRGRNIENKTDKNRQVLEPNLQGITNTITSVQKDNLIVVGNVFESGGQAGKVYDKDAISPTVSGQRVNSQGYINTSRIRRLTPLECMRLQGFPDSYKKVCSETQQYKMAGNTITVNVIKAILKNLVCTQQ